MVTRRVPYDLRAEEAVVGSQLLNREAIVQLDGILEPEDFYSSQLAIIYGAVRDLYRMQRPTPADLVTLQARLQSTGQLDAIGGVAYLTSLVNRTPTAAHVIHYAEIVAAHAARRRLIGAGGAIAALGYEEDTPVEDLIAKANGLLFEAGGKSRSENAKSLWEMSESFIDQLESKQSDSAIDRMIKTGYQGLDRVLGGLIPGTLVSIGAATGVGKTSLAESIALNGAKQQRPDGSHPSVVIHSLEMRREEIFNRLVSVQSGVEVRKLTRLDQLTEGELSAVMDATGLLAELPVRIDDTAPLSIQQLRAKARAQQNQHGLDLLVIDYLQLLTGTPRRYPNEVAELGEISRGLKLLAKELDVPVIACVQLNRQPNQRTDRTPRLSDIRGSGTIEMDSDIVILLDREDLRNPETSRQGVVDLIVSKNRFGARATVFLHFDGTTTRFSDSGSGWLRTNT